MNKPHFFISEVIMENFRGYKSQEFKFFEENTDKKGVVLISGPNGYGKTTLLDAIEWCLTGTVKRLEREYNIRNEKGKILQRALLRHTEGEGAVQVEVKGYWLGKTISLCRTFEGDKDSDGFNLGYTDFLVSLGNDKFSCNTIDDVIKKSISQYFYDRYICSYEKNISMYEKGREDFYSMFSSFFGGVDVIENIMDNLEGYGSRNDKYVGVVAEVASEIKSLKKVVEDKKEKYHIERQELNDLLSEKSGSSTGIHIFVKDYPKEKIFQDEIDLDIIYRTEENFKEIHNVFNKQYKILQEVYSVAKHRHTFQWCKEYIKVIDEKIYLQEFREQLVQPFREKESKVLIAQNQDIKSLQKKHNQLNEELAEIKNLTSNSRESLRRLGIYEEKYIGKAEKYYIEIRYKFELINQLFLQLKSYEDVNNATKALRSIVDHIKGFHELQEGNQLICPLCGSENAFSNLENTLGQEAKNLLGKIDSERAMLKQTYDGEKKDFNEAVEFLKNNLTEKINNQKLEVETMLKAFEETKVIKLAAQRFKMNFEELTLEKLLQREEQITFLLEKNEESFLELEYRTLRQLTESTGIIYKIPSFINKGEAMHFEELLALDLKGKRECINQFGIEFLRKEKKVQDRIGDKQVEEISIDTLKMKLEILRLFMEELKQNYLIATKQNIVEKAKDDYETYDLELKSQQKALEELKYLSKEIKKVKTEWDKKIANQINEPLQKIYKRLNRHTNIQTIDFMTEGRTTQKAKMTVQVNDTEVFVPNVLSTGQLSIVSLSIFLTIALGQKDNPFRCYFMDDPIQTLDDLNVLSFVDLIRTELTNDNQENRFMDQLFITTCDESFEKLISHKMRHFNVNLTHIRFKSYHDFNIIRNKKS
ncbi:AAA family ATPase [Bacillus cereus]|uniref:AAA family ATPase n=1 Tax=Bacillus cereus TaxID=1396 RepID=UPI0024BEEFC6|nr:AAA family ATPase [Bacillus cereus]